LVIIKISKSLYMNDTELLHDIYYVKKNFDGINNLFKKAKVTNKDIKKEFVAEWLSKQGTNQQTLMAPKRIVYLPIYSDTPFSFQIDLTFFPRYKLKNDNYYVLFTAININTRFAYAYYTKSKDAKDILEVMKRFKDDCLEIDTITTDKGSEFINSFFNDYCIKQNIVTFYCKNDSHKLGIINRFHRTLKEKLLKYMTANDTVRWIDVIDEIVYNYNHTVNRGIGIEPYKVNNFIQTELISKNILKTINIKSHDVEINIGDKCRILNKTELFEDKMTTKYSNHIYIITKVSKNTVTLNDGKIEKKSDIIIINDATEDNHDNTTQDYINKLNKVQKLHKKLEILPQNIVPNPSINKVTTRSHAIH